MEDYYTLNASGTKVLCDFTGRPTDVVFKGKVTKDVYSIRAIVDDGYVAIVFCSPRGRLLNRFLLAITEEVHIKNDRYSNKILVETNCRNPLRS